MRTRKLLGKTYHASEEPLPPSSHGPYIRRAYRYLESKCDDQIAMARALKKSPYRTD